MASTNTEKPTGKAEQKKVQAPAKNKKMHDINAPVKKTEEKKEKPQEEPKQEKNEAKTKEKKIEVKKVKKSEVSVNVSNLPISTKYSLAICKFINHKTIPVAIKDLEQVQTLSKPVPMKGEIPHRKGRIMSGRFPTKAAERFVILLKSLQSNAIQHDLENPVIKLAVANKGTTVYGGKGRTRRKRTNVKIVAIEKKENKK